MKEKSEVWSFHNPQLSGCWLLAAHILFAFKDPEHSENIYPKPRKSKKKQNFFTRNIIVMKMEMPSKLL